MKQKNDDLGADPMVKMFRTLALGIAVLGALAVFLIVATGCTSPSLTERFQRRYPQDHCAERALNFVGDKPGDCLR